MTMHRKSSIPSYYSSLNPHSNDNNSMPQTLGGPHPDYLHMHNWSLPVQSSSIGPTPDEQSERQLLEMLDNLPPQQRASLIGRLQNSSSNLLLFAPQAPLLHQGSDLPMSDVFWGATIASSPEYGLDDDTMYYHPNYTPPAKQPRHLPQLPTSDAPVQNASIAPTYASGSPQQTDGPYPVVQFGHRRRSLTAQQEQAVLSQYKQKFNSPLPIPLSPLEQQEHHQEQALPQLIPRSSNTMQSNHMSDYPQDLYTTTTQSTTGPTRRNIEPTPTSSKILGPKSGWVESLLGGGGPVNSNSSSESYQNPPINTIYVGNLPTSLPTPQSARMLKNALTQIFSRCPGYNRMVFKQKNNGPMCFVVFDDVSSASKALRELNGNTLNGLVTGGGIRLSYSKNPLGVRTTVPNSSTSQPFVMATSSPTQYPITPSGRQSSTTFQPFVQPDMMRKLGQPSNDTDPKNLRLEELMMQRPPVSLTGKVSIPDFINAAHGGFATVYTGVFENRSVAVKVLKATKNRRRPASWERSLQRRLEREIKVWAALSHPNIIEFLGYSDDFGDFSAMVSTWCQHGTAGDYLANDEPISNQVRLSLVQGVASGLDHLHQLKIVHGDLKPTNVLIDDQGVAQLCDFGLVRLIDWEGPAGMTTTSPYTGTERYKAPELFTSINNNHPLASFEGDIYALGCIALEFMLSQPPYHTCKNPNALRRAIEAEESPAARPNTAKTGSGFEIYFWDMLEACWDWSPSARPKVGDVVYALSRLAEFQEAT